MNRQGQKNDAAKRRCCCSRYLQHGGSSRTGRIWGSMLEKPTMPGMSKENGSVLICIFSQLKENCTPNQCQWPHRGIQPSLCPAAQQVWVCTFRPGHEAPPFWGAGLLHSLLLSWVPALHADQELQQLQRPSALAPAEKISQERRRLARVKQLVEMYGGRAILSPWSGLQSLRGEMPWGNQPRPLCSPPCT